MATTVQSVYDSVCNALLEDGGLVHVYSEEAFLDDLLDVIRDLLMRTGIIIDVYDIRIISGTSTYSLDESASDIKAVFVDKKHLQPSSGFYLDFSDRNWGSDSGFPEVWRTDNISDGSLQVTPTPDVTGAVLPTETGNLKVFATRVPTTALTMADNVPLLPDTVSAYLKFGVLEKIFSADGEAFDSQRAKYCGSRVSELTLLLKAIMSEEVMLD